ncbi:MAG: ABC transporter ATP-binding protein, partial [Bacteroidales bacterium]
QRVGIAQSIIHDPKFIVLDEPTNGLDPNQILEIRNLIKEISNNKIVLLSTHILQEVQAMCDDIIMIELGKFVFDGTIGEFNSSLTSKSLILSFGSILETSDIEIVEGVEGVEKVEVIDENKFRVFIDSNQNVQKAIIEKSVDKGWHLDEIFKEKVNPDEIFKYFSKGAGSKLKNKENNS